MNVGDIVEYKKEDYLAIKVNEKSVYICKNRNFLNLWENRVTGTKWKTLCDREEAKKVSPDQLIVKEEGAVEVKPKKSRKKRVLSSEGERHIKECYDRLKKQAAGKKTKAPMFLIETSNEKIWPVAGNVEKGMMLFHILNLDTWHFFDVNSEKYSLFKKEEHKLGKDILWPEEV
jgi:predicted secreted protein